MGGLGIPSLFLLLASASAKNIFPEEITHQADFIPIGSRYVSENRPKRTLDNDDRGAQNVYYVSRTPSVWGTAWLTCRQAMNGDLLTVETESEDLFIRDMLIENQIASVWTAGAFDSDLGIWRWVSTGGEVSYANWFKDQPSSNDGSVRIGIKNSLFSHGWQVLPEDTASHYICEVRSEPVEQPTPEPEPEPTAATTPEPEPEPTAATTLEPTTAPA